MSLQRSSWHIVLDADDTFFHLRESIGVTYSRVAEQRGIRLDPTDIDRAVKAVWHAIRDEYLASAREYRTSPEQERIVWGRFIRAVFTALGVTALDSVVENSVYDAFADPDVRRLAPGIVEFLESAKQVGIPVSIASNNDRRTRDCLRGLGVLPLITQIFLAPEIGWKKPSRRFFSTVADAIGVPSDCLIHIGNDPALDVEAALDSGWEAVLYDPAGRHLGSRYSLLLSFREGGQALLESLSLEQTGDN